MDADSKIPIEVLRVLASLVTWHAALTAVGNDLTTERLPVLAARSITFGRRFAEELAMDFPDLISRE